ncbi:MAG: proton-conducting transporter membrane subunit [Pseudomonadota bacterium]
MAVPILANGQTEIVTIVPWIQSGELIVNWELALTPISAIMTLSITTVSAFISMYAVAFWGEDPTALRFSKIAPFLVFAALIAVAANNLVMLVAGLQAVTLASSLLVAHHAVKPHAMLTSVRTFVINHVADVSIILGIAGVFMTAGAVSYDVLFNEAGASTLAFENSEGSDATILSLALTAIVVGLFAKAGQFLFHAALSDTSEAPAPAFALILSVCALPVAVFTILKIGSLFEAGFANDVLTFVSIASAVALSVFAVVQTDLKRAVAFIVGAQLAFSIVAFSVGATNSAFIMLVGLVFAGSLLALGAGSVVKALSGERDLHDMGGLREVMPRTWGLMFLTSIACSGAGLPLMQWLLGFGAGSKYLQVLQGLEGTPGSVGLAALVIGAVVLSVAVWRTFLLIFHGAPGAYNDLSEPVTDIPYAMFVPMAFVFVVPVALRLTGFEAVSDGTTAPGPQSWVSWVPVATTLGGFIIAYLLYVAMPGLPKSLSQRYQSSREFLITGFQIGRVYDVIIARPAKGLGQFASDVGDKSVIDGYGPPAIASRFSNIAKRADDAQKLSSRSQAISIAIGLVALSAWLMISAGTS